MSRAPHILIVDDEAALGGMIADYLAMQGVSVSTASGGTAMDAALARQPADLILLDINMPGEDGLAILRRLRSRGDRTGIILVTANGDEASKLCGLSGGADDYIVKPFELRELLARIRSVHRRLPPPVVAAPQPQLSLGPFRLDTGGRRLTGPDGQEIEVSQMEFDLLAVFARHPRQILSRDRLCELAHGRPLGEADRSVDIRITRLRKKLESDPARPRLLCTVRGEGYLFDPAGQSG